MSVSYIVLLLQKNVQRVKVCMLLQEKVLFKIYVGVFASNQRESLPLIKCSISAELCRKKKRKLTKKFSSLRDLPTKKIRHEEKDRENHCTCLCSSISKMFLREIETSTRTGCPEREKKC